MIAAAVADAHEGGAGVGHNGADVGKVHVDHARNGDDVGDALYALPQHVVRHSEGFHERHAPVANGQQFFVRHDDDGVNLAFQFLDTGLGQPHPAWPFKRKRLGDDRNRQRAHFRRDFGNHRCGAGSGSAAHACRDEHHIRAIKHLFDFAFAFLGRHAPDARIAARAQTPRGVFAKLEFARRFGNVQHLHIRIHRQELNAAQA